MVFDSQKRQSQSGSRTDARQSNTDVANAARRHCTDHGERKSMGKKAPGSGGGEKRAMAPLMQQRTALGKKTECKAHCHGDHTDPTQCRRFHFQNLTQPALHGFGRGHIGQPFQDQHQANEGEQQFHGRSITRKQRLLQPHKAVDKARLKKVPCAHSASDPNSSILPASIGDDPLFRASRPCRRQANNRLS